MEGYMTKPIILTCWKCGNELPENMLPIRRTDACKRCHAELHVCKICEFYDPHVSDSCREPIADSVSNKERANFCGYFKPKPSAYEPTDSQAQSAAQDQLDKLFGTQDKTTSQSPPLKKKGDETIKQQLNELFSSD